LCSILYAITHSFQANSNFHWYCWIYGWGIKLINQATKQVIFVWTITPIVMHLSLRKPGFLVLLWLKHDKVSWLSFFISLILDIGGCEICAINETKVAPWPCFSIKPFWFHLIRIHHLSEVHWYVLSKRRNAAA
jgi:hypothetical protein